MIDYLEWLLAQQEVPPEENAMGDEAASVSVAASRVAGQTRPIAVAYHRPERQAAQADPGEREGVQMRPEIDMAEQKNPLSIMAFQSEGALSSPLFLQPEQLSRAGMHSWAATLYRQTVSAAQAAANLQQNGNLMSTPAELAPTLSAVPNAARLDELFARDARRYDGGFSMY